MKPPEKKPRAPGGTRGGERPARVAAQLGQEVAKLLGRELADPRLAEVVVARTWVSPDLGVAKVFFRLATLAAGPDLARCREEAEAALSRATGRVRKAVTARLGLRVAPELRFVYDEGQDARTRIEELLHEVDRDRRGQ